MTKVLVTGAGGFAGAHAVEHFLHNTGWDVLASDSFLASHKGRIERLDGLLAFGPRLDIYHHNLNFPVHFKGYDTRMQDVDYIIAYASQSHVDRSITDPVPFVQNNVNVALHTLELARKVKPRAVVWVSTDEVYGATDPSVLGSEHMEWDPILPSNPYAASKAAQEAIAISYWRTYGVPLILVNCMNMFGERQDAEKYVPMLIKKISAGEEVTVHGTAGNIGSRYYLHARNLADAILYLLERRPPAVFPGNSQVVQGHLPRGERGFLADEPDRYHVASPDCVDNLTLAELVASCVGKPLRYRLEDFHSARPGHDPHYGLDDRKLAATGWKPPVPFLQSLQRTVEWTLKNRTWLQ